MILTKHAAVRIQQRAIPEMVVDWLELFGAIEQQPNAELIYFDRRSLRRLASYTGGLSNRFEKLTDAYLVRSEDGRVITVGYRNKRILRKKTI